MADNLTTTTTVSTIPSGSIIATDELAGAVHAQYVKLLDGTSASATPLAAGNGVHGNALRVTLASDGTGVIAVTDNGGSLTVDATSLPLPTGAATAAEQATQTASLSVIDDWDESDRAKVNPIVGQAGVQGGSGTVSATTQRVTHATDVAIRTDPDAPAGIFHGQTNVTTAGTEVAIASTQAVKSVTVKAKDTNTGNIFVGGNPVTSTTGFILAAGDSVSLDIADLATVFIDSAVNGEGVSYVGVG